MTKKELIGELALSRQALSADLPELARRCNPVDHLRRSFAAHPAAWIAASTVAGLVTTKVVLSKRKEDPRDETEGENNRDDRQSRPGLSPVLALLAKGAWTIIWPAAEKILRERLSHPGEQSPRSPQSP